MQHCSSIRHRIKLRTSDSIDNVSVPTSTTYVLNSIEYNALQSKIQDMRDVNLSSIAISREIEESMNEALEDIIEGLDCPEHIKVAIKVCIVYICHCITLVLLCTRCFTLR